MKIDGFQWDEGNESKNFLKHDFSQETIEALFSKRHWIGPDTKHSSKETRFLAIGFGEGNRPMIVAFTLRIYGTVTLLRPISARYLNKREVRIYEKEIAQIKNR